MTCGPAKPRLWADVGRSARGLRRRNRATKGLGPWAGTAPAGERDIGRRRKNERCYAKSRKQSEVAAGDPVNRPFGSPSRIWSEFAGKTVRFQLRYVPAALDRRSKSPPRGPIGARRRAVSMRRRWHFFGFFLGSGGADGRQGRQTAAARAAGLVDTTRCDRRSTSRSPPSTGARMARAAADALQFAGDHQRSRGGQ